jgi:YggT family protein
MGIVCAALNIYVLVIFARVVLSWFPITPGTAMASVQGVLQSATEPVLAPLRRMLPTPRVSGMGLDLSPIIVVLVIELILTPLICR